MIPTFTVHWVLVCVLVELLVRCTTYILKLAGWLDVGIGRAVKGWGCDPDIYSSASWCWFAYCKGVGMRSRHLQFTGCCFAAGAAGVVLLLGTGLLLSNEAAGVAVNLVAL